MPSCQGGAPDFPPLPARHHGPNAPVPSPAGRSDKSLDSVPTAHHRHFPPRGNVGSRIHNKASRANNTTSDMERTRTAGFEGFQVTSSSVQGAKLKHFQYIMIDASALWSPRRGCHTTLMHVSPRKNKKKAGVREGEGGDLS